MTAWRPRGFALAFAALLVACGNRTKTDARPDEASAPSPAPAATAAETTPPATTKVTLYFPSASGDGLAQEEREIVDTKGAADRGAQILAALIDGPKTGDLLPAVPRGTSLRRLWVREDGSAYADFSDEFATAVSGGSTDEILTVYAIVDSLTANIPEIHRVGILVAGRERENLGHLDLSRPLPPDLKLASAPKATE